MRIARTTGLAAIAALALIALVGAGPAAAAETTLCETGTDSPYCESEDRYPAETALKASATGIVTIETDLVNVKCAKSAIEGKTSSAAGEPLSISVSAWSLSGCGFNEAMSNCKTTVAQNLPYSGSLLWSEGANGTLAIANGGSGQPGWLIKCGVVMDCVFTLSPSVTVKGGSSAQLVVPKTTLGTAGGDLCPGYEYTATLNTATYAVELPQPLYVANAEGPPEEGTHLCKAAENPCMKSNRLAEGTLIEAEATNFEIESKSVLYTCKKASVTMETQAEADFPVLPIEVISFPLGECKAAGIGTCEVETTVLAPEYGPSAITHYEGLDGILDNLWVDWQFKCGQPGNGFVWTFGLHDGWAVLEGGSPAAFSYGGYPLTCKGTMCTTDNELSAGFTVTSPKPLYVGFWAG